MLKKIQHTYDLVLTYLSAVLLAAMFIVLNLSIKIVTFCYNYYYK